MKLPAQLDNNSGGGHWGSLHQAAFISGQSLSAPGQAILLCLVVLVVLGDVRCLQTNRHRWYIFCCQVGSVSVGPVFALENRRSQLLAPRTVAIAIRLRLADKSRGIYHCCPNWELVQNQQTVQLHWVTRQGRDCRSRSPGQSVDCRINGSHCGGLLLFEYMVCSDVVHLVGFEGAGAGQSSASDQPAKAPLACHLELYLSHCYCCCCCFFFEHCSTAALFDSFCSRFAGKPTLQQCVWRNRVAVGLQPSTSKQPAWVTAASLCLQSWGNSVCFALRI